MKIDDLKLLGKDVTVKKKDGSFLKGLCINQFSDRLIINPNGLNDRIVTTSADEIVEISFDDFKAIKTFKEAYRK